MNLFKSLAVIGLSSLLVYPSFGLSKMSGNKEHIASKTKMGMISKKDIIQTAMSNPQFSTLVKLLKTAGLVSTLKGKGPFTVLAPTNAAFAKVPKATLSMLMKDKAMLKDVLLYHVVSGSVPSNKVAAMSSGMSVSKQSFMVSAQGGKVMINNATVTKADIMCKNGIIHVIDTVLMPPSK